jgi:hypothetical protein
MFRLSTDLVTEIKLAAAKEKRSLTNWVEVTLWTAVREGRLSDETVGLVDTGSAPKRVRKQ